MIKKYRVIIWDFDGTIKESLSVKSNAFKKLFVLHGKNITSRIVKHHNNNMGLSRYKKIPLYLSWIFNKDINNKLINEYYKKFSKLVTLSVINSKWVPGAKKLIQSNPYNQKFMLVTATPQKEIVKILQNLNIIDCFSQVFGSPLSKTEAIKLILKKNNLSKLDVLMIGDTEQDYQASKVNKISFLFKKNKYNHQIIKKYKENYIIDFKEYN